MRVASLEVLEESGTSEVLATEDGVESVDSAEILTLRFAIYALGVNWGLFPGGMGGCLGTGLAPASEGAWARRVSDWT